MSWLIILRRVFNLSRDLLFAFLAIRTIPASKTLTPAARLRALLCLLLLFCMAAVDSNALLSSGLIRFSLRGACLFLYLYQVKKISLPTMLYDALLTDTVIVVNHNLFLTPLTRPFLNADIRLLASPVLNEVLCLLIVNAVSVLIYSLVYFFLPLKEIMNVGRVRILILLLLAVESQYLNSTLKLITEMLPGQSAQFSIYVILLQLALLLCLMFIERNQSLQREQTRIRLENQSAHALLEAVRLQQKNDGLIRALRHDLKNHLISIRFLIAQKKETEALAYIDRLLAESAITRTRMQTGSDILDGILAQKMAAAEQNHISFSVAADFTCIRDMEGADLCIIFGNLLDNAIEACLKVDEPLRCISIRGRQVGESVLYSLENTTSSKISLDATGLPHTTKKDDLNHGIGLISVRRMVKKNGGTLAFSSETDKFTAIVSFPVRTTEL